MSGVFDGGGMTPAEHLEAALVAIAVRYEVPIDELAIGVRLSDPVRLIDLAAPGAILDEGGMRA